MMRQMNTLDPSEAVRRVNAGEWIITEKIRRWREENGVIRFTLPPTDGTTGLQWVDRFQGKKMQIGVCTKSIFLSDDFKPTSGVVNEIVVLKGILFEDSERITKNIRAQAKIRELIKPNAEVACLIREMFTDAEIEEMGLRWIVAMHEPIKDFDSDPGLLGTGRFDDNPWLNADSDRPDSKWNRDRGFAFVVAQM
jgi:hypothetical protein